MLTPCYKADTDVIIPAIPQREVIIGDTDTMVGNDQDITLAPGSYGDVMIRARGKLVLSDGEYHMNSLTVEPNGEVMIVGATSDMAILVAHDIQRGNAALITTEPSTELTLYSNTSNVVSIGGGTTILEQLIVPNGDVSIASNSLVSKVAAKNIRIEPDTQLNAKR